MRDVGTIVSPGALDLIIAYRLHVLSINVGEADARLILE